MGHQKRDTEAAIGVPRVAAAVLAFELLMKMVDVIGFLHLPRLLQFGQESIPLGIDIRANMVGDLAGLVAQADALVKGGRAEPDRPFVM